jgi:DNA polymerase III delta prime subunit
MTYEKNNEFLFVEKYRPHKIEDCILPERLKKVFQEYVTSGDIPNLMLTGSAGCGKTTVAKAMCEEVGLNHIFINSSEERGIDMLRTRIKGYASTVSLTGGRKVIILDEADYLTPEAQAGLRGAIEEFSANCSFIFTCNFKARLIDALHSRCAVVDFTLKGDEKSKMAMQMFKRLTNILSQEGIEYDKAVLAKIVERYFPDYRRTLNELQRYSTIGNIDAGVLSQVESVRKLDELVSALKEKDFSRMRKWVVANSDIDPSRIYQDIYDDMHQFLKPESMPYVIVTIAKYQYQQAFVANAEINLVACLTEIMVEAEFK